MSIWSMGPPGTKRVMAKTSMVIPRKVGIRSKRRRAKYAAMKSGEQGRGTRIEGVAPKA